MYFIVACLTFFGGRLLSLESGVLQICQMRNTRYRKIGRSLVSLVDVWIVMPENFTVLGNK